MNNHFTEKKAQLIDELWRDAHIRISKSEDHAHIQVSKTEDHNEIWFYALLYWW